MEKALNESEEGRERVERAKERIQQDLAEHLEKAVAEGPAQDAVPEVISSEVMPKARGRPRLRGELVGKQQQVGGASSSGYRDQRD